MYQKFTNDKKIIVKRIETNLSIIKSFDKIKFNKRSYLKRFFNFAKRSI